MDIRSVDRVTRAMKERNVSKARVYIKGRSDPLRVAIKRIDHDSLSLVTTSDGYDQYIDIGEISMITIPSEDRDSPL